MTKTTGKKMFNSEINKYKEIDHYSEILSFYKKWTKSNFKKNQRKILKKSSFSENLNAAIVDGIKPINPKIIEKILIKNSDNGYSFGIVGFEDWFKSRIGLFPIITFLDLDSTNDFIDLGFFEKDGEQMKEMNFDQRQSSGSINMTPVGVISFVNYLIMIKS